MEVKNVSQVEIVILANSIKHGQHCVAGKCVNTGSWIRPVSDQQGSELSNEQAKYQNPYGVYPVRPLQKIRMGFLRNVPLLHQPENRLIDGNRWQQHYSVSPDHLADYVDSPKNLWGRESRVVYTTISNGTYVVPQSLYLVQVENLTLYYTDERKRRAVFTYNDIEYDLAVTDPSFDEIIREQREIQGILCVSLGEEFKGYCYKLVATIF